MNPKDQIPKPEESLELDQDASSTVDDFIKELEAKEKDLHITSDMTIEVDESEPDAGDLQTSLENEVFKTASRRPLNGNAAHSAGASVGLKTRVFDLQNQVETLQERIKTLRGERNEIQEKSDRRLKDFENYKYRMDRERRGAFIDQISNLALQMLPVLDNLDRAITSVATVKMEKQPEFQQFFDGIALVNQQVNEIFTEMGVQPISTKGEVFDPNLHEAVAVEERTDVPANTVLNEMLRGYRIGNRVIRHSMVKVTTRPAGEKAVPAAAALNDELDELLNALSEGKDVGTK